MSALVEIFKRIDVRATRDYYQRLIDKKVDNGEEADSGVIESLHYCDTFLASHSDSGETSLAEYVISAFPVMPQSFRPIMKNLNVNGVPDFDWHYKQILNAVSDVKICIEQFLFLLGTRRSIDLSTRRFYFGSTAIIQPIKIMVRFVKLYRKREQFVQDVL